MAFEIIIKQTKQLTEGENSRIEEVDNLAFNDGSPDSPGEVDTITWAENDYYVLGLLDGNIISLICLLTREVHVGELTVRVGGVGGVATHPEFQRRGFAGLLLQRAENFMREGMKVPYGMLVCSPEREPYYRKFGWEALHSPMVFDTPHGKQTWPDVTMMLPLSGDPWPFGTIDLCGAPW